MHSVEAKLARLQANWYERTARRTCRLELFHPISQQKAARANNQLHWIVVYAGSVTSHAFVRPGTESMREYQSTGHSLCSVGWNEVHGSLHGLFP